MQMQYYISLHCKDRSESPPKRILDSPSPTREQKARQAVAEATASVGGTQKWKMQIGPGTSGNSRFKKKVQDRPPPSTSEWGMDIEKRGKSNRSLGSTADDSPPPKKSSLPPLPPTEKAVSVRKAMERLKEPPPKKPDSPKKMKPAPPPMNKIPQGQVVLDKFGNFRLMTPPELKKEAQLAAGRRPPEPPGRPRSDSRSPKRRSRSRSKYSRSPRSSSGSRSRSRSYRSRSRSYYSRSRSRSGSYYSRSRSRSRSYSGDRRRYVRRGGFRGRHNNDRGTYYKPRFQNPRHNGQRGRGGGYYNNNRDSRYGDRDYRGRGRPYPYQNRGNRRQPRGRYGQRGGYRDYRDRRYSRSRSRDRDRRSSYSGSGSDASPPSKRDRSSPAPEKEKINKYSDGDAPVRHEGPLSEGEDRDDYISTDTSKLIDREIGGKWADKEETESQPEPPAKVSAPPVAEVAEVKD